MATIKELSIEEKAKAYDELKVKAQELEEDGCFDKLTLFDLFPELAESEDERIRKALMQNLKERFGTKGNMGEGLDMPDVLAWFENQGEQKPVVVIPKFRVGDVIRPKGSTAEYTIESISGECYHGKGWGLHISGDDDYELVGQKSSWSEEDKCMLNNVIDTLKPLSQTTHSGYAINSMIDWLKSLKDRIQLHNTWKPSDRQLAAIATAIGDEKQKESDVAKELQEIFFQLKKLKG